MSVVPSPHRIEVVERVADVCGLDSLRRRFQQNQEDCTFTVLALLPTATDNVMAELETERITFALQEQKAAKLVKSGEWSWCNGAVETAGWSWIDGWDVSLMYLD